MPDGMTGGVLIVLLVAGMTLYGVEKVTHAGPVVKFNHEVCHIVTFGKKCKPKKKLPEGYGCGADCMSLCVAGMPPCQKPSK